MGHPGFMNIYLINTGCIIFFILIHKLKFVFKKIEFYKKKKKNIFFLLINSLYIFIFLKSYNFSN
jgi:membrane protein CcdC involved in cytochrome C biogenesis